MTNGCPYTDRQTDRHTSCNYLLLDRRECIPAEKLENVDEQRSFLDKTVVFGKLALNTG